MDGKRLIQKG